MKGSVLALMQIYIPVSNNIGAIVISSGSLVSLINTKVIGNLIATNSTLFYTFMCFVSIGLSVIVLSLILFSRFFINSCESFNVKPISAKFGSKKYTFESQQTNDFTDNYLSNGTFKVRDTSIVSIWDTKKTKSCQLLVINSKFQFYCFTI